MCTLHLEDLLPVPEISKIPKLGTDLGLFSGGVTHKAELPWALAMGDNILWLFMEEVLGGWKLWAGELVHQKAQRRLLQDQTCLPWHLPAKLKWMKLTGFEAKGAPRLAHHTYQGPN